MCLMSAETRAIPACFILYELYTDEAAVQAHLAAPHFKSMSAQTASWVASKQVRRLQAPLKKRPSTALRALCAGTPQVWSRSQWLA